MSDIPPYKDEYWDDALKTLKREERKAAIRRLLPFFFIFSGVVVMLLLLINSSIDPSGKMAYRISKTAEISKEVEAQTEAKPIKETASLLQAEAFDTSAEEVSQSSRSVSDFEETTTEPSRESDIALEVSENQTVDQNLSSPDMPMSSSVSRSDKDEEKAETSTEMTSSTTMEQSISPEDAQEDIIGSSNRTWESAGLGIYNETKRPDMVPMNPIVLQSGLNLARTPLGRSGSTKHRFNRMLPRTNHLFAAVGTSLLTGYGASQSDLRFNPEITLGYAYQPDPYWSVSAGLSYYEIGGIRHGVDIDQIDLGFSALVNRTSITTDKLIYIGIPIQVDWNIDLKHSIGLSWNSSFLVTSSSTVSTGQPGDVFNSNSGELGYVEGYNSMVHAIGANYKFRLNNRWTAGMEYQYGLNAVNKTEVYEATGNDNGSRAVIRINYQIRP